MTTERVPRGLKRVRNRPTVVVAGALAPAALEVLSDCCEVVDCGDAPRSVVLDAVAEAEALIVRSSTVFDGELLAAALRLRIVGRAGSGLDNVDLELASASGVEVVNTPGANAVSVAEHTFALLLAAARSVPAADRDVREGGWDRARFTGAQLCGKTLAIVGLGRVGMMVAQRALAFEMTVVGFDPFAPDGPVRRAGIDVAASIPAAIRRADVVTLHIPLTPSTANMVDRGFLELMRPGGVLINTARGGLVVENDVLGALESGQLGGAAFDVFCDEPNPCPELVRHPRVVSTPHIAASTPEAQERAGVRVAELVLESLRGAARRPNSWPGERGWPRPRPTQFAVRSNPGPTHG